MGLVYATGSILALLFIVLAIRLWYRKHKKEVEDWVIGWACYTQACHRGYIKPTQYEADKIAIEYANKYNKKHNWIVIN